MTTRVTVFIGLGGSRSPITDYRAANSRDVSNKPAYPTIFCPVTTGSIVLRLVGIPNVTVLLAV